MRDRKDMIVHGHKQPAAVYSVHWLTGEVRQHPRSRRADPVDTAAREQ